MPQVIGIGGENCEIFWTIVLRIAVYMMHDFLRRKVSPKHFFRYKPMLRYSQGLRSMRMIWTVNIPVSGNKNAPTTPIGMTLA